MKITQYTCQRKLTTIFVLALVFAGSCSGNETLPDQDEPAVPEEIPAAEIWRDTVDLANWPVVLGVNYNEQLQFVDYNDLKRTETTWVRGFVDFFQLYDSPARLNTDEKIINYLSLQKEGYRTILNIKWNFKGRNESLPAKDSPDFDAYMNFLDEVLSKVWYQTDLLVIGNEPFIETRIAERDQRLVDFYMAVTHAVIQLRDRHPDRFVPIFVGAFNNLYEETWQTTAVSSLLSFVKNEPGIAGVDLHIHHSEMEQITTALNFASSRLRDNQKILVTEFSLMKYWKAQMKDTISGSFAEPWQINPAWQNYQYIDYALKNPRPVNEWIAFLQNSVWFESRKHYLKEAHVLMTRQPKFLAGTYAIRQSYPFNQNYTATTDPWVLNGLFANRTVEFDPLSGQNQFNYSFIDDFIDLQQ